ncbi:MAG: alpha-1,2-fucosyltransferase [Bacteroidales bacterium]|nr:alpha-1,2-fucosyltransferase [Bacteroidales bacterium]
MKLVAVTGGLGNQMFGYAFMLRLSKEHHARLFHPFNDKAGRYGHAGFQLDKVFKLRSEDGKRHLGVTLFGAYWHVTRIFPKRMRPFLLRLVGMHEVRVAENFVFYPEVFQSAHHNELFMGTWQSPRYFEGADAEVREALAFKEELLNEPTQKLHDIIVGCNAVSLHVRHDDYLSTSYAQGFGGICTKAFYQNAIAFIKQHTDHPKLFVFSDDINWCRENLDVGDATFVDCNHGNDSWQDMYLMSCCKHNIIANSTFSWWGAWLNPNPDKIVVAPQKWWNGLNDDVVPDAWTKVDGNEILN